MEALPVKGVPRVVLRGDEGKSLAVWQDMQR